MPADDRTRVAHMMRATEKAVHLSRDRKRKDLDSDELLALGLTRLLEIIGEAAGRVSTSTRDRHPDTLGRR